MPDIGTLVPLADGRALLSATMTSAADQKPEALVLSLVLPCSAYAGGTWKTSNGKSGTIPKVWDGRTVGMFTEQLAWIEFAPVGGSPFRLSFPQATISPHRCASNEFRKSAYRAH